MRSTDALCGTMAFIRRAQGMRCFHSGQFCTSSCSKKLRRQLCCLMYERNGPRMTDARYVFPLRIRQARKGLVPIEHGSVFFPRLVQLLLRCALRAQRDISPTPSSSLVGAALASSTFDIERRRMSLAQSSVHIHFNFQTRDARTCALNPGRTLAFARASVVSCSRA